MTPPIIDAITHISTGPDDVIGWGPRFLAEDLLAQMDAPRKVFGEPARIDKAVVFPALGDTAPTSRLSFEDQHRYVVESVAAHPDRLIGGIVMHARLWDDEVATYARRLVQEYYQKTQPWGQQWPEQARRELLQVLGECWSLIESEPPAAPRPAGPSEAARN